MMQQDPSALVPYCAPTHPPERVEADLDDDVGGGDGDGQVSTLFTRPTS